MKTGRDRRDGRTLTATVQEPTSFDTISHQWQAFEAFVPCSFFQSWAWTGCLAAERFDAPVLIEVRHETELVAMALFNRRRQRWPRLDRLWLGESGQPAWDAVFIEHNGALLAAHADPERDAALRRCLLAALWSGRRGRAVMLSGIGPSQTRAADALGATRTAEQTRLAPYVDLGAITAAGLHPTDHLSANTRYQLRRSARRYAQSGTLRIARAGSRTEAHAFLDAMAALHQATWRRRGRPGAFANPAFARFHHALIDRTDAVDMLHVTAGDKTIGYLHQFRHRGRVSAYQSGFVYPEGDSHAKPGMTCHHLAIEHYFREGMTVYDFLAGDDRYKTSLATASAPLHWIALAPRWSLDGMAAWLKSGIQAGLRRCRPLGSRTVLSAVGVLCLGLSAVGAATVPQPGKPGELVSVVLENAGATPTAARMVSFGQVFLPGQVAAGQGLTALIGGRPVQVQLDLKAAYPDGSVRIGVVTLAAPALPARGTAPTTLLLAQAPTSPALDLATLARTYDLSVDLTMADGGRTVRHIDGQSLLAAALGGNVSYWLRGDLASEIRVDAPVVGSFHVTLDIRGYADGTSCTDVQFRNDLAMQATGGTVAYDAAIRLGGGTVYRRAGMRHFQYQSWHWTACSNGAPQMNIRHDIAMLARSGMVPNYDLAAGVNPTVLASQAAIMAVPGWGVPLAANGVAQYMPGTGGRADIGPITQGNAAWLVTQSAPAAAFALGQADAAGAVPWQFWNASTGTWLNTDAYPDIWIDGRGGPASTTTGLTQQVDPGTGWTTDPAHQPDLAYIAYLMTGRRRDLDMLNAQAAFSILYAWPDRLVRNKGEANVIRGNQLRGAAWSLRQIDEAAWSNPPGSPEQLYFSKVAIANWHWLAAQLLGWSRQEGQTSGYILGSEYGVKDLLPPWQQDYFVGTAVQAALQGNADARAYLAWSENFIAGRFLNAAAGFNPRNGVAYLLGNVVNGAVCDTWAQLQYGTAAAGQDNGAGWAHSDGDYAQLALASLAGLATVTGSSRALQAYRYLLGSGAPYSSPAARRTDVQYNVTPAIGGR